MNLSPAGEWSACGERFYHKKEVYSHVGGPTPSTSAPKHPNQLKRMPTPLYEYRSACARFGGPVALTRDETILLEVGSTYDPNQTIHIASMNGEVSGRFPWKENHVSGSGGGSTGAPKQVRGKGKLVNFGWTSSLVLLCVDDSGSVFQYDTQGELLRTHFEALSRYKLGSRSNNPFGDDHEDGVEDLDGGGGSDLVVTHCEVWDEGCVVIAIERDPQTGQRISRRCFSLLCQSGGGSEESAHHQGGFLQCEELKCPGLEAGDIHAVCIAEPLTSISGKLEVFLAVGDSIFVVDAQSCERQSVDKGPILLMSLCPNGQLLAAYAESGDLLVVSTDFTQFLTEFQTSQEDEPDQLVWCGVDSVVMRWEEELVMVGPYGDSVAYNYDDSVILIPECDGVRILSDSSMEFLYRVPDCMVEVYRPGSTAPGALLYDARQHFDNQTARADENLRQIGEELEGAIDTCLEAAGYSFDVAEQKRLLRAASYGHVFCPSYPKDKFRDSCESLRVLNGIRDASVGIPLTLLQYQALTPQVLVSRLANAGHHLLACRIAEYKDLGIDRVLHHWARQKILKGDGTTDQELCDSIVEKLQRSHGSSIASVASYAFQRNRKRLAAMLLEFETRVAKQVPLLLEIGESQRAIDKAIESGDADLVYYALFYVKQRISLQDFLELVNHRPQASSLFISYCKKTESDSLKTVLQSMGRHEDIASTTFEEILQETGHEDAAQDPAKFAALVSGLQRTADLYTFTKEHAFESRACMEYAKLLKSQRKLEDSQTHTRYTGLSVAESMSQCVMLGNARALQQLKSDFKITDKQFWYLRIRTLAQAQDWNALLELANEKKSPVGYLPFYNAARERGAPNSVLAQIIRKISDARSRAEKFAAIGMVNEAAEAAAATKDQDLLTKIRGMAGTSVNSLASNAIEGIRGKFHGSG